MKSANIALVTCLGGSLQVPILQEMENLGILPKAIIIDGKMTDSAMAIQSGRLDPNYKLLDLSDLDLPNIPCYFVQDHNSEGCISLIKSLELDYIVNAGTPRILKEKFLTVTRGVLNVHPGILPNYRGCTAVEWSIYNNDPIGASVHFMETKIDVGPIILVEKMRVEKFESYETIRTRINDYQAKLMAKALKQVLDTNCHPSDLNPQQGGNYYKPISAEFLLAVKSKLTRGEYESIW